MTLMYAPAADAPRRLTLELNSSGVRLIFPPAPATVYLVSCAAMMGCIVFYLFVVARFFHDQWNSPFRPPAQITAAFVGVIGIQLPWFAYGARSLWKQYKFQPREITAYECDGTSFIRELVTWKHRRIRRWPLADVTSASCKPLRFALARGKTAHLRIGFRRRVPFIRTIRGERDIQIAREFVERFEAARATSRA